MTFEPHPQLPTIVDDLHLVSLATVSGDYASFHVRPARVRVWGMFVVRCDVVRCDVVRCDVVRCDVVRR